MSEGTILVVDDNTTNLKLVSDILGFEGYRILQAGDAESAQEIIRGTLPDLILMDIALPGMDGEELIARMRRIQPKLPALISSGRPHEPALPHTGFLQKPFLPKMLIQAVEKALSDRGN